MACATLKGACSHVLASARPALACRANAGESATCCSSSSHEAPRLSLLGSVASRPCSRILGERERDPCCLSEQKPGSSCLVSSRARASGSVWTTASTFFGDGGDAGDGRSALCSYAAKKKITAAPTTAGDHGGNLLTATRRYSRRTGDMSFSSSSVHGCRVASPLQGSSDEGRCQQRNHVHRSTGPRAVLHVEKVETSLAAAAVAAVAAPPPAWPGFVEVPADKKKWAGQKPIALIGSTGSIGTQTLDIVSEFPEYFRVVALAAGSNITLLAEQIRQFQPSLVSVSRSELIPELKEAIADVENKPEIVAGAEGLCAVAAHPEAVTVVTGIVGCAGLPPTVAAIKAGKDIALANKETLIAGGPAILPLAHEHAVKILPADSEHSAIFQCLQGLPENGLRRIILTASGGAFRDWPVEKLKTVKVADALKHPNWSMGKKITIDSASLMNKGLEVIEAHYLFGADYDNIDVVIHPQSIIHSMVETQDSSILAQLGWPDMRLPIIYTMSWPQRIPTSEETWRRLDFIKMGDLTFREPDRAKYPSLDLAYAAGRAGGTMTGVLSAANEKAVELFIEERISYLEIMRVNEMVCVEHMADLVHRPDIDSIIHFDQWARQHVEEIVNKGRLATAAKL